jgi:hypothetical protein
LPVRRSMVALNDKEDEDYSDCDVGLVWGWVALPNFVHTVHTCPNLCIIFCTFWTLGSFSLRTSGQDLANISSKTFQNVWQWCDVAWISPFTNHWTKWWHWMTKKTTSVRCLGMEAFVVRFCWCNLLLCVSPIVAWDFEVHARLIFFYHFMWKWYWMHVVSPIK